MKWLDRSNCFIYAVCRWFRYGGYLLIRKSRWGWFPHFLHGNMNEQGQVEVNHFVPEKPIKPKGFLKWFPIHILFFKGKIKNNDLPVDKEE